VPQIRLASLIFQLSIFPLFRLFPRFLLFVSSSFPSSRSTIARLAPCAGLRPHGLATLAAPRIVLSRVHLR